MRYFCCHFATTRALKASHKRINVGKSAIGRSLVTFFGIKKNIVVQACCGHFHFVFHLLEELHDFSPVLSSKPNGLSGGSRHIPLLFLLCTISTLFPIHTILALVGLPQIFSAPCSSKVFPLCAARFRHVANALPTLLSLLHSGPTAWFLFSISCSYAHASTPAARLCLCEPFFCCPRPCTCPELLPILSAKFFQH